MKKFKLLTASLLASMVFMTGCNSKGGSEPKPVEPDPVCEDCEEPEPIDLPEVVSVSFKQEEAFIGYESSTNIASLVNVEVKNGASKEVTWSSENELMATVDAQGNVVGHGYGTALITATSKFDPTKKASISVRVVFEKALFGDAYGCEYTEIFPEEAIRGALGIENEMFVPSAEVSARGIWYTALTTQAGDIGGVELVFNISAYDGELGNEFLAALDASEDYMYYYDAQYEEDCYMSWDMGHTVSWTGIYTEDYSNMYLCLIYYDNDVLFYGTELTEDTEWSENHLALFKKYFGKGVVPPFGQFGTEYKVIDDEESQVVMIADFSANYLASFAYEELLVAEGFKYSYSEGAFFKELKNGESLFVQVQFTSFGNTIAFYKSSTVYLEFPQEIADEYTANEIGTANKVLPIELANELCAEWRVYFEDDYYDDYEYDEDSMELRGLLADYSEFEAAVQSYIDEGFEIVDASEADEEHLYSVTLTKGALEVTLTCEVQLEIDWDTFTFIYYWDACTICVNAHHSSEFEGAGVFFYASHVDVMTEGTAEFTYVLNRISGKVSFAIGDESIATVDANGVITGVAEGDTFVTVICGRYSAQLPVHVEWSVSNEHISFGEVVTSSRLRSVHTPKLSMSFEKGSGAKYPSYSEGVVTLYEGNTVEFSGRDLHCMSEVDFEVVEGYDGVLSANKGTVEENAWYAADTETGSVTFTATEGTVLLTGFDVCFDDAKVHSSKMSIEDIAYFIAYNYLNCGYENISVQPLYEGYEDICWVVNIVDDYMYPYADYGDDGLEYEMWDLAFYVPEEFTQDILDNYYMGEHYMYGVTGCMCDAVIGDLELDIMIWGDPDTGYTMIEIDIWNWAE